MQSPTRTRTPTACIAVGSIDVMSALMMMMIRMVNVTMMVLAHGKRDRRETKAYLIKCAM